ncbi:MAG: glycerol-3-phosphate 1-O-acyltransferase PlsY [Selenomonadaceae bacterium]|nr:glycerol-3-phosphate 1-O-acyltransferase PlsY [Selenomonadaceae bacterium]
MTAGILIFSYLLGSIPNGLIFGKLIWHKDLRQFGSKNIGATNAWRVIGAKAGILIFLLDFLKGALSVGLAKTFVGDEWVMVGAGLLAILGHTFSIFLKLRGGKGVATGLGVISVMMPQVTAIVFATWLIIFLVSRYVSLASIIVAALTPILAFTFDEPIAFVIFGAAAALFIIIRHRENIIRLIHGKENRFK